MKIQHNISAMNAERNLRKNRSSLAKNLEKLSSGYRINRSADDAAGLSISEKMRAEISCLDQCEDNIQHGINLFHTADGALDSITSVLQRLNQLCVSAGNGTYGDDEKQAIQNEIDQLVAGLDSMAKSAECNEVPLLYFPPPPAVDMVFIVDTTGSMGTHIRNVAANLENYVSKLTEEGIPVRLALVDYRDFGSSEEHTVKSTAFIDNANAFAATLKSLPVTGGGDGPEAGLEAIMDPDHGAFSLDFEPNAIKHFVLVTDADIHVEGETDWDGKTDSYQYTIDETAQKLLDEEVVFTVVSRGDAKVSALAEATGAIQVDLEDENFSREMLESADKLKKDVLSRSYYDLPIFMDPNADSAELFRMWEVTASSLGIDPLEIEPLEVLRESIEKVLSAINRVSDVRAHYGAYVNRLEHALANNNVYAENLTSSESQIRDADVAAEMMEYTKNNILTQSAQAMLAQSNQVPQSVLQLMQ